MTKYIFLSNIEMGGRYFKYLSEIYWLTLSYPNVE